MSLSRSHSPGSVTAFSCFDESWPSQRIIGARSFDVDAEDGFNIWDCKGVMFPVIWAPAASFPGEADRDFLELKSRKFRRSVTGVLGWSEVSVRELSNEDCLDVPVASRSEGMGCLVDAHGRKFRELECKNDKSTMSAFNSSFDSSGSRWSEYFARDKFLKLIVF